MCRGPSVCQSQSSQQHPEDVGKSEMPMTDTDGIRRPRRVGPHWSLALSLVVASIVALSTIFRNRTVLSQMCITQSIYEPSHAITIPQAITRLALTARLQETTERAGLHVVISHCSVPLDWIFEEYLLDVPCKSVTIYTKCGRPLFSDPSVELSNESLIRVETMPNVGRCDHSYAWWIVEMLTSTRSTGQPYQHQLPLYHPNDQVLFMKDNDNMKRHNEGNEEHRTFELMRDVTVRRGFDCGSRYHARGFSGVGTNYADKAILGRFHIRKYKTKSKTNSKDVFEATSRPLSAWTEKMPVNVTFTTNGIVEVCLGGVFMTTIRQILNAPVSDWNAIVTALSRGDNIEEGHYMERLWAVLLAPPLSSEKRKQILEDKTGIKPRNGFLGFIFVRKDSPILKEQ
jgi:hypothetical protein